MIGLLVLAITVAANNGVAPQTLSLARPVRIVSTAAYKDGGTVGVTLAGSRRDTLSGGFDGRIQIGGDSYPWHCYVGGSYIKHPGVRMLPLWGAEERAFVALVQDGIDSRMSIDTKRRLLATKTAGHHSAEEIAMWNLVRRAEDRRELLDALDRGEIMGDGATLRFFECKGPLTIARIARDPSTQAFEITIADRDGGRHTTYLPGDSASVTSEPTRLGGRFNLSMPVGTNEDRLLMQLVFMGLRADAHRPFDGLHARVRELMRIRRRKVLSDDGAR